jgi:uncharacterized protein (DUF111 family)
LGGFDNHITNHSNKLLQSRVNNHMHTQDYMKLEIRISDFEHELIAIHAEFNEVRQIVYEPKQENNKNVGISYVVTNITNPNHLTPTKYYFLAHLN